MKAKTAKTKRIPKRKYLAMQPSVKKAWAKALRSKQYIQTSGRLYREPSDPANDNPINDSKTIKPGSYCCLGVLWEVRKKECPLTGRGTLQSWFTDLVMLDTHAADILADKNDSGNWSFHQIATWIEKNL